MLEILLFAVFPSIVVFAFILGLYISKNKQNKIAWALLPLAFILILYIFNKFPSLEYAVISHYYYGILKYFIPLIPLLFLFGLAAYFHLQRWRKIMYFAFAGTGIVVYFLVQIQIWRFNYKELEGKINQKGDCLQSTPYTCGPAAAVTMLNLFAIKTSEAEISQICRTFPLTGTNEFVLQYALNFHSQKYGKKNLFFTLKSIHFKDLSRQSIPYLAMIRLSGSVAHWIVIKSIEGDQLKIFDPLTGNITRSKWDYKNIWLNRCIVIAKSNGG